MFGETPTVNQRCPGLAIQALDEDARHSVRAPCEDTHLEVHQLQILNARLIDAEVPAERLIERVHRAIAFARIQHQLSADPHLDDGFGDGDKLALARCGAARP